MNSRAPGKTTTVNPSLTRDDWLDAAFKAVVDGGFDNVRVLTIANTLGVTRGSFYWHFSEQSDLVAGLLQRWRDRQAAVDRSFRHQVAPDPPGELLRLLDVALAHVGPDLEHMRFELALRGLGRRDPVVAQALLEVDQMRMGLFVEKFERLTGDAQSAADLATLFYLAVVGSHQALSRPSNPSWLKDHLKRVIHEYLVRRQVPTAF
ncbi:MAG: TetR/AcrR family transcriptional regulator [Rhodoferax sp.]|nr:TetR/AcrR family transcriptional regulator [Rhodoferax sp.]MCF8211507.1 TetR/AcrR family transcriptional regulator [Rhodoferax sp.]